MGFENFPKNNKEIQSKEIKKPFLERIRKSKLAKAIAFAGMLGASGAMLENYFDKSDRKTVFEQVEKKEISLGELSKQFSIKKEIEGKNPLILHIGQVHGADSLDESLRLEKTHNIISHQKDLEHLLIYLKDSYAMKQYFVEGLEPDILTLLNGFKAEMRELSEKKDEATWSKFNKLISTFKKISETEELSERYRAYYMYAIQLEMERELTEAKDKGKNLEGMIQYVKQNPLIAGDAMYLWGSPVKLFIENKIEILPAETIEANEETFSNITGGENLEEKNRLHRVREDAALNIIKETVKDKETITPLIYGAGHDFKSSVEQLNQTSYSKIGLIKIEPH